MTRQQQIEEKARELGQKYQTPCHGIGDCEFEAKQSALEMAQWADQNPAPNLVDIDKVCEAFCKCECCGCCGEHKFNCTILGDFKNAMKGE